MTSCFVEPPLGPSVVPSPNAMLPDGDWLGARCLRIRRRLGYAEPPVVVIHERIVSNVERTLGLRTVSLLVAATIIIVATTIPRAGANRAGAARLTTLTAESRFL